MKQSVKKHIIFEILSVAIIFFTAFFAFYNFKSVFALENRNNLQVNDTQSNILVYAYYEEFNNGNGEIYSLGSLGGSIGLNTDCGLNEITIDTTSQTVFYAQTNAGYVLDGVYSTFEENIFGGDKLEQTQNGSTYSISYNGEESLVYYAKFSLKRVNIVLDTDADFTLNGQGQYLYGESVTISCQQRTDLYKFSKWNKVDGENEIIFSNQNNYTFIATESCTLKAIAKFLIQTKPCFGGNISLSVNNHVTSERYFEYGQIVKVNAVSDVGYSFVDYDFIQFKQNESEFEFMVTKPISFGAIFESKTLNITFTLQDEINSSIKNYDEIVSNNYVIGDEVEITIIIDEYYILDSWTTNASGDFNLHSLSQTYTVTAQDAQNGIINFSANILKKYAKVKFMVLGGGTVSVGDDKIFDVSTIKCEIGETISVYFYSNRYYELTSVKCKDSMETETEIINAVNNNNNLSVTVNEDYIISVRFAPLTWLSISKQPTGLGTKENPYLITCEEEFAYIAYGTNYNIKATKPNAVDFNKAYYKLQRNINLAGRYWILVGANSSAEFNGVIDLNYKSISNIVLVDNEVYSNYKLLFTNANIQHLVVLHETSALIKSIGLFSSIFFAVALLIMVLILVLGSNKKVKKIIVIDEEIKK